MHSWGPDVPSSQLPTLSTSLLDGAKRMDSTSWSRLVTTFGPIVYGWSRAAGISAAGSADVVQDVFVTVARGIGSFERQKESGSFRSWLATITRSRVRDHLRIRARREAATGGTDAWQHLQQQAAPATDASRDESIDSSINLQSAERSLSKQTLELVAVEFEQKTWKAFWMTTVEDRAVAEVANELGMSAASVYQARSRILRRLRQRLAELP